MAQDAKKAPEHKDHAPKGGAPAAGTGSTNCKSEACKRGQDKFGFCMEHYELYMAGVLRGDGKKPIDYDNKLRLFHSKHQHGKKVA